MMNALQKAIVHSIYERNNKNIYDSFKDIKETFTVTTICDMLSIKRDRYYYLVKTNRINMLLLELLKQVQDDE